MWKAQVFLEEMVGDIARDVRSITNIVSSLFCEFVKAQEIPRFPQEYYLVYLADLISFELWVPMPLFQTALSLESRREQIGPIAQGSALLGKPSSCGCRNWLWSEEGVRVNTVKSTVVQTNLHNVYSILSLQNFAHPM